MQMLFIEQAIQAVVTFEKSSPTIEISAMVMTILIAGGAVLYAIVHLFGSQGTSSGYSLLRNVFYVIGGTVAVFYLTQAWLLAAATIVVLVAILSWVRQARFGEDSATLRMR